MLIIALITISSCTKPECKTSADCSARTCYLSKCEEKKCAYTLQINCCGNKLKESIENGKPGNQCTCPDDYGKCEGKPKVKAGPRLENATYLQYLCNVDNQCVLGVDKKDIAPQNFLDTINLAIFKASAIVRYNKPFDVKRDSFELTITLDDMGNDLVLPISLAKVKLLFNSENTRTEQLIAEEDIDSVLNGVGDKAIIRTQLNLNYRPQEIEEGGGLRYLIDYAYKKQIKGRVVNGTTLYTNETVRGTFSSPTKPVLFVRSS